jgi:threonine 3-dehydrogenase
MRAIIKRESGVGLEAIDIPVPDVGPFDVLVKVKAATICGSDFPIYNWDEQWIRKTIKPGQIVGHEFCGVVVEYGKGVSGISVGELVTAEGHINCSFCSQCKSGEAHLCPNQKLVGFNYPGVFAEYAVFPVSNIIKLGNMPLIVGALQDPFGCAVHSTMKVSLANASALISGCGPIGLMTIGLAKIAGAQPVFAIEKSSYRIDLAVKMGADLVLNPNLDNIKSIISEKTSLSSGVDVLFEMSGDPEALRQGFKMLRPGGTAVLLGIPKRPVKFDFSNDLITKGITVHGVVGRTMFKTWEQARKFVDMESGTKTLDLTRIVTHRFLLDEFEQAFEIMQSGNAGKAILFPDDETRRQSYEEVP